MAVTTKTPRILAAAKEFNIGRDTLINFLDSKGFEVGGAKPTSRLTVEMYEALQDEFQQDRANKRKSDQIDLPRGVKKEKVEEEKKAAEAEAKAAQKKKQAKEESETKEDPEIQTPQEKTAPAEEDTSATPQKEDTEKKGKSGLNVVGKINLSELNTATRPKRASKKKKEVPPSKKKEEQKPKEKIAAKKEEPKAEKKIPEKQTPKKEESKKDAVKLQKEEIVPPEERIVEQTAKVKLTGPRLVGKIDLPEKKEKEKAPKDKKHTDKKRKRKRIPVEGRSNKKGRGDKNKRRRGGNKRQKAAPEHEIDEKEIQDKIKQTQAKLSGTSKKSLKAKRRKAKREEKAEQRLANEEEPDNVIQVTEFVSVNEFANLMDVSFTDVISKCMSIGIMVSINQRLDAEVIELVASEFGFDVEFIDLKDQDDLEDEEEDAPEDLKPRSPIITIMGHVDHGKTSLLDHIRKTTIVAGEVGGITQHIGAYEVTLPDSEKKICFLDTPGHEAFTAMRARGATVGDVAVIVIAADDAIMPQTKEAISHAQAASLPMIFAINKVDKEGANPEKIKEQLAGMNILVEDWGGKYQSQEISAKKGLHIDQLLDKILLEAELLELKANPDRNAMGTVIDASLDKGRGYVTSLLIQNGTLKKGDMIVAGPYYGRMKALFNERGQRISVVPPSTPVQVLGLNGAPQSGEKIRVYQDESEAKNVANERSQIMREQSVRARKHITLEEIGRRLALGNFQELNIIIKGDVDGSVEALSDSFQKLSTEEIVVNVVHKAVGQITESDVLLATASDAIIVGFQVRPSSQAAKLADVENIEIRTYSIIYTAIEEIKSAMEGMLEPKIEEEVVAHVEIRETYKINKSTIAGCFVQDGKISRNSHVRLIRDGIVKYTGDLGSLKHYQEDAKEIKAGMECGLSIKNYNDIKVGDTIEAYEETEVKRTLS